MSLRAFEGFDHYNSNSDLVSREGALTWTFQQVTGTLMGPTGSRFNYGQYYELGEEVQMFGNFQTSMTDGCVGFAMRMGVGGSTNGGIWFRDTTYTPNVNNMGGVAWSSSTGQLYIVDKSGNTIASSPNGTAPSNAWFFLDIRFKPGNPGTMSVRMENQPVAGLTNITGNFEGGSGATLSTTFNQVNLVCTLGSFAWDIDDFHYNDCTSSDPGTYPNNDFMGDTRALALYPTSDFQAQWTKSAAQFLDTNGLSGSTASTSYGHGSISFFQIIPTHTAMLHQLLFSLNANFVGHAVVGLYTDNNGSPQTLLAQCTPIVNANATGNWFGFDLSASNVLIHKGVTYWIAISSDQNFPCQVWMGCVQANQPNYNYNGTLPATANPSGTTNTIGPGVAIGMIATANYMNVGENVFDGDASYNYTTTAGLEDLFNCDPLVSTTLNVLAVQIVGAYRKDDAQQHTLTQRIKSGSTDVGGHVVALSSSWFYTMDIFPLDPGTGASWTVSGVNTMQVGYKMES